MTLLDQILRDKRQEVARAKADRPLAELQQRIKDVGEPLGFARALTRDGFGIIAEIKRKSPSMSEMIAASVEEAPAAYKESAIVKAVSILTDTKYFGMGIEDLEKLKQRIGKPALRKDFIFDQYQVWEARAFGADAILLMASVLTGERMSPLFDLATQLKMDVLFECHSAEEIASIPAGAKIYGINSRKFKTSGTSLRYSASRLLGKLGVVEKFGARDFSTDLELFQTLTEHLPKEAIKVAESGLTPKTIMQVRELGFHCALIGTSLLKSPVGVTQTLDAFQAALRKG